MNRIIAIVEDDPREAQALHSYLDRFALQSAVQFDVRLFHSGRAFLNSYQPIYDLVFMDINLPDLNGMDVAASLRKADRNVVLIFVTSMAQYAVKGYEVDALDFMVKPVTYAAFCLKMKRAISKCTGSQHRELLINTSDGVVRTSAARIRYVEVSDHALLYHTVDDCIHSYGNLKKVELQLDPRQFVRCNRCYLVNLAYVLSVQGSTLILDNGTLQISRPKRTAFLEALANYLGGGI